MAYASVEQVHGYADTGHGHEPRQPPALCSTAAAVAIDQYLDRPDTDPLPDPAPHERLDHVNVVAAVELAKAASAVFGVIGFADIGVLPVSAVDVVAPATPALLMPHKLRFGVT